MRFVLVMAVALFAAGCHKEWPAEMKTEALQNCGATVSINKMVMIFDQAGQQRVGRYCTCVVEKTSNSNSPPKNVEEFWQMARKDAKGCTW